MDPQGFGKRSLRMTLCGVRWILKASKAKPQDDACETEEIFNPQNTRGARGEKEVEKWLMMTSTVSDRILTSHNTKLRIINQEKKETHIQ
jgi:hypothetical protein